MKKRTKARHNAISIGVFILILAAAAALRTPVTESLQRNRAMIALTRYTVGQPDTNAAAALRQAQQAMIPVVTQDPERFTPIAEHLDARAQMLDGYGLTPDAATEVTLQQLFAGTTIDAEAESNVSALKGALTPTRTNACPAWQLEGSWIRPPDSVMTPAAALLLAWRQPNGAQPDTTTETAVRVGPDAGPTEGWRLLAHGDMILQFAESKNLIDDGGFEREVAPSVRVPVQLPEMLYKMQNAGHTAIVNAGAQPSAGFALQLDGRGETPVGVASQVIPLPAHTGSVAYLVTGRYRTDAEADPRIGIQWLNNEGATQEVVSFMFVVQEPGPVWTTFRWLVAPRADADAMSLWVLNRDSGSGMVVDDLGVFETPLPCKDVWGS